MLDWFVAGLKLVGAAVALLSITRRPRWLPLGVLTVVLWGAFGTVGLYVLGSMAEAIGMITGITGGIEKITPKSTGYVVFFLAAAVGYGLLAISHARRHRPARFLPVLGVIGAPAVIGMILVGIPLVLDLLGIFPDF